jgi:RNA polymerase sigma-70 factor (ECF subfamily)
MNDYLLYDNKQLVCLFTRGDKLAFTEIYNRYWQKLFSIAYNRLKEIQTAEDVVHDVFISLWANRERSEIESLENYLATSTKYMVLARIKKKERERIYNNSVHPTPVIDFPVEASVHYKRILEIVKTEVEKLPEKCKLIFKCSRTEGKPVQQIADELSLSTKTVENQLNKALKHLKAVTRSLFTLLLLLLGMIGFVNFLF